jgi:alpha-glucosidase
MSNRYSLLPYIYTLMYNAHSTGATVMRALAWEFPNDPTLIAADRQFLLGPSIMVIPILTPLARNVSGVFPGIRNGEKWYNWHTHTSVQAQAGENKTLNGALGHIPVFIRGGAVLPLQGPAYTTTESRQNDWAVLLALGSNHTATGSLYLDDGESLVQDATRHVSFSAVAGSLTVTTTGAYVQTQPLANVTVLGMMTAPSVVSFNAGALSSWTYDRSKNALYVVALQNVTVGGVWMANWTLSWS